MVDSVSVWLAPLVMMNGRSKLRSMSSMRHRTATTTAPSTIGRVMRRTLCHGVAPSTLAASYSSPGMICRPASTSSAMNGAVFQMSAMVIAQNEGQCLPVQMTCVWRTPLITPFGLKFHSHSLADTAVGIAQGTSTLARTRPRPRKALLVIGFSMALVMNKAFRGRGLVRASVLVPWAIPTAVSAKLWLWNFNPNGVINGVLHTQVIWTGRHWPSFWAITIADIWKTAPFIALLVLAGLQIIPGELYEAARVDGATPWQSFRRITLPMVKGAVVVAVLFRMLDVLRIFDLPFIMTNGANQTETLSTIAFKESVQNVHIHYGSALSTITFVYIIIAAFVVNRLARADVVKTQSSAGVK